jgi:DNA/RNA-binding domain of Phe-tRNA-synthetase-like protein
MVLLDFSNALKQAGMILRLATLEIRDFLILTPSYDFSPRYNEIISEIKASYTLDNIKEQKLIALYRKFYWEHLNIDPTKTRPAAEALIRRILGNKPIPCISPFVDAYNWASIQSLVPMGAYDMDLISPPIKIRLSNENEVFSPITQAPKKLPIGILITSDAKNTILCQYPYRDSQITMVRENTKKIVLMACGIEGFEDQELINSLTYAEKNLKFLRDQGVININFGEIQLWKN